MTKRRVEELSGADLAAMGWGTRRCSYVRKRPTVAYCFNEARFRVVVDVAAAGNRKAHTTSRVVCDLHAPRVREVLPERPEPDLIGVNEVVAMTGVDASALCRWRKVGRGPAAVKWNGRYWYRKAEIERFSEARKILHGLGFATCREGAIPSPKVRGSG